MRSRSTGSLHEERDGLVARRHRRRRNDARVLVGRCRVHRSARVRLGRIVQEEDCGWRDRPRLGGTEDVAPQRRPGARMSPSANGRIAYIRATTVVKDGSPASSSERHRPGPGRLEWHGRQPGEAGRRPARGRSLVARARDPLAERSLPATVVVRPGDRSAARRDRRPRADGTNARRERPKHRLPLRPQPSRARASQNVTSTRSARRPRNYLGLSLDSGRLVWAENHQRPAHPRVRRST